MLEVYTLPAHCDIVRLSESFKGDTDVGVGEGVCVCLSAPRECLRNC